MHAKGVVSRTAPSPRSKPNGRGWA